MLSFGIFFAKSAIWTQNAAVVHDNIGFQEKRNFFRRINCDRNIGPPVKNPERNFHGRFFSLKMWAQRS
jgi:hypothetical protein